MERQPTPSIPTVPSVFSVYHHRLPLFLAAIISCSLPLRGQELEAPMEAYPPELLAEVARLVDDLSSESYASREAAGRRLLNIGEAAWDRVFEASQSASDLELRYRAAELLKTLQKKKFIPIRGWE